DRAEGESDLRTIVQKLFDEIAPRYKDRPGGYTRIIKRHQRRLGDGGKTAFLELLKEGETKSRAKEPAPAPRVEEDETQEEATEEQTAEEQEQAQEQTEASEEQTDKGSQGKS